MWFYFPVSFLYSHILQANCTLSLTNDAAHHILPTWGLVQDLPREQHSQLSPGEDTKQCSKTEGKGAPAAKGHRALPARKQTLCMWHPARFIWQVGRLRAHTRCINGSTGKSFLKHVCITIVMSVCCALSLQLYQSSPEVPKHKDVLKLANYQIWSEEHVAISLCFSSFIHLTCPLQKKQRSSEFNFLCKLITDGVWIQVTIWMSRIRTWKSHLLMRTLHAVYITCRQYILTEITGRLRFVIHVKAGLLSISFISSCHGKRMWWSGLLRWRSCFLPHE